MKIEERFSFQTILGTSKCLWPLCGKFAKAKLALGSVGKAQGCDIVQKLPSSNRVNTHLLGHLYKIRPTRNMAILVYGDLFFPKDIVYLLNNIPRSFGIYCALTVFSF